jgi:hypothetical protein
MDEVYTLLPAGKRAQGVLLCPNTSHGGRVCGNHGPHYPSASAPDEEGNKVRRWKCYKCEKYFREPSVACAT